MADAKLTALTAASALAAADLFYVSQSAASRKATGTQLLALVGTAYVPLAGGTMTGALTIASGTLTASAPALIISQTWNNVAVGFIGIQVDITNTTSGTSSSPLLINLNGSPLFSVTRLGRASSSTYAATAYSIGLSENTYLQQDAVGVAALRFGTQPHLLRVYSTYSSASVYSRASLTPTATAVTLAAEELGTGSANLDIVLTPAGTGKVGIGTTSPSWKLTVASTTTACDMAVKDSVGAIVLSSISGAGFLSTNSVNPIVFRINNVETHRITSAGMFAFGDVTSSYPALKRSTTVLQVRLGDDSGYGSLESLNLGQTGYHQMTEMTAPSAPAANSVRIYAEDNGSGKTRLMALFATGAAQQLAIEP